MNDRADTAFGVERDAALDPLRGITRATAPWNVAHPLGHAGSGKARDERVSLLPRTDKDGAANEIDDLKREAKARLSGDPRAAYRTMQQRLASLAERLERIRVAVSGNAYRVFADRSEAHAWQTAEAVAKALRLPVIDLSVRPLDFRDLAELDLSLEERFARGLAEPAEPGEPSSAATARAEGSTLHVAWKHSRAAEWLLPLGLGLIGTVLGVLFLDAPKPIALPLFIGLGAVGYAVTRMRGHGTNRIDVTTTDLVVRLSPVGASKTVPLSQLEQIRVDKDYKPSLNLITDTQVHRLPMHGWPAGWVRGVIEQHIAAHAASAAR